MSVQYEFFRSFFSGSVESVEERLQLLRDIGELQWNSLGELVGLVVAANNEAQLQALSFFLEAIHEPTYQASAQSRSSLIGKDESSTVGSLVPPDRR
jgi:hypothetical protein